MEYDEFRAMNTDVVLAAEGEPHALRAGFEQARQYIEASEARFTRFAETGELAALNRATGEWTPVSAEMFELLREARAYVEATGGLFDPSILADLEHAGYDRSMDEIRRSGASAARAHASTARASIGELAFDAQRQAVRLPRGLRLDLGGIAKGWIAERAAQRLAGFTSACAVNAGGDMFMLGLPAGETSWAIEVEDPRDLRSTLAILDVGGGAVATSSVAKRRWRQGPRIMHHLIDPRTHRPAESDWLSVTVVAPHAATAEVFAKALLIAGSRGAEQLVARRKDIAYLAVDAKGQLGGSMEIREIKEIGR